MPQVLPVVHAAPALGRNVKSPLTELREAKVESIFLTSSLPQDGQDTSSTAVALRTSSSKGCSQSAQINSKSGMFNSSLLSYYREYIT
jgi:hypothetical protein